MKNILLNTESILHKTLWIACLLFLTLHSFSSSCLWHQCYDSLRDGVSDFTFQERPWYSWAYEKIVHALDLKLYRAASSKVSAFICHRLPFPFLKPAPGYIQSVAPPTAEQTQGREQLFPVSFWSWPWLMHDGINSFSGIALVTMTIEMWCLFIYMKLKEEQLWHKPSKMGICYSLPLCV